jgi:hypothetical protein
MWMEQHLREFSRFPGNLAVTAVGVLSMVLISRNAYADALVPVVAVFDLPVAVISIFWIAPLEAGVVRLREPAMRYRDLLWDFWVANWISLVAGILVLGSVFGILATLGAAGIYDRYPVLGRWVDVVRPFEPDGSTRPFRTIFLVSLGWVVVTLPVSIVVEGRCLGRRWSRRGDLVLHPAIQHSVAANVVSYIGLVLALVAIFLRNGS